MIALNTEVYRSSEILGKCSVRVPDAANAREYSTCRAGGRGEFWKIWSSNFRQKLELQLFPKFPAAICSNLFSDVLRVVHDNCVLCTVSRRFAKDSSMGTTHVRSAGSDYQLLRWVERIFFSFA